MGGNINAATANGPIQVRVDEKISSAIWLDNGKKIEVKDNGFMLEPFPYGEGFAVRVAKRTNK